MKKISYFFAMLAMCSTFALTSCGDDDPEPANNDQEQTDPNDKDDDDPSDENGNSETCTATGSNQDMLYGNGLVFQIKSSEEKTIGVYMSRQEHESIVIPAYVKFEETTYTVNAIGMEAFRHQEKLASISFPKTLMVIGSSAFTGCTSLTKVVIPNSVTSIGLHAFSNCTCLTSVVIGKSVTKIGNYPFGGCTSLAEIKSLNTTPPSAGQLGAETSTCVLKVPKKAVNAYKKADGWKDFKNIVGI